VGLVNRVIGSVVMVLAAGGSAALFYLVGPATLPLIIGLLVLTVLVVSVFTSYLNTAYYTCLYLWATATEAATAPVPAPAPLAAVAW
jgi:hypothetical protein